MLKHKTIHITLFALALIAGASVGIRQTQAGTAGTTAATRYVDPNGSDTGGNTCIYIANACRTSQHAMDVSFDGDTINLAAGIYYVNLETRKSLTLNGAGAGNTFLDGEAAVVW